MPRTFCPADREMPERKDRTMKEKEKKFGTLSKADEALEKKGKMKKLSITLSDEDFAMLEDICKWDKRKRKSNEIAWLILQEWKRLKNKDAPSWYEELIAASGNNVYIAPRADNRIIQFPVRQI
jgi:uncharacterized protein with ATP-grasp and redox domains